jgi:hypothetical protein
MKLVAFIHRGIPGLGLLEKGGVPGGVISDPQFPAVCEGIGV